MKPNQTATSEANKRIAMLRRMINDNTSAVPQPEWNSASQSIITSAPSV